MWNVKIMLIRSNVVQVIRPRDIQGRYNGMILERIWKGLVYFGRIQKSEQVEERKSKELMANSTSCWKWLLKYTVHVCWTDVAWTARDAVWPELKPQVLRLGAAHVQRVLLDCAQVSLQPSHSELLTFTFRIINFWTRDHIHCNWCSIDVWHVFLNICAADMGQLSYGQLQLPCFSYSYVWLYVKTSNYNCDHAVINYNSVKVVIDPCLLCWCCELILTWS